MPRLGLRIAGLAIALAAIAPLAVRAEPPPDSLSHLRYWLQWQRADAGGLEPRLAPYPEWRGRCPNVTEWVGNFLRNYHQQCGRDVVGKKLAAIKDCAGVNIDLSNGNSALKALKECKEKIEKLQGSAKAVVYAASEVAGFVKEFGLCTIKSVVTAGDMTVQQRQDWIDYLDALDKVRDRVTALDELGELAANLVDEGLDIMATESPKSPNEAVAAVIARAGKTLDEDRKVLEQGLRTLTGLREAELRQEAKSTIDLLGRCEIEKAAEDRDSVAFKIETRLRESRRALVLAEEQLYCAARDAGYERLQEIDKALFLNMRQPIRSTLRAGVDFNRPELLQWSQQKKLHDELLVAYGKLQDELSDDAIAQRRADREREDVRMERIAGMTLDTVRACGRPDANPENVGLPKLKEWLDLNRESACGKAGLAGKHGLDQLASVVQAHIDAEKAQTEILGRFSARTDELLGLCETTKATDAMRELDGALVQADLESGVNRGVCLAPEVAALNKRIDERAAALATLARQVDGEIQAGRRAAAECDRNAGLVPLRRAQRALADLRCGTAPGVAKRLREIELLQTVLESDTCRPAGPKPPDKVYFLVEVTGAGFVPHYVGASYFTQGTFEKIITLERDDALVSVLTAWRDRLDTAPCDVDIPAFPGLAKLPVLWISGPQIKVTDGPALKLSEIKGTALLDTWSIKRSDGPPLSKLRPGNCG